MDEYYRLAQCLPQPYAAELAALPIRCAPYVQEIRLRAGQSMLFTVNGRVSPAAKYLPRADRLRRLTAKEVQRLFPSTFAGIRSLPMKKNSARAFSPSAAAAGWAWRAAGGRAVSLQ